MRTNNYNVFNETNADAVWNAIVNMGYDSCVEKSDHAQSMVQAFIEASMSEECDEEESTDALAAEVFAALGRLFEAYDVWKETDAAIVWSAIVNMGIEHAVEFNENARTMLNQAFIALCDGGSCSNEFHREEGVRVHLKSEVWEARQREPKKTNTEPPKENKFTRRKKQRPSGLLPYPDMPLHVDNLNKLSVLERSGWQGTDASLEESLGEYGFAWKVLAEPDEDGQTHYFIYRLNDRKDKCFGRCSMKAVDPRKEWNWVNWHSFLDTWGCNEETFLALPFEKQVYQLFTAHGYMNIFGEEGYGFPVINRDGERL